MQYIIIIAAILSSFSLQAGVLSCKFTKNGIDLLVVETTEGVDEEENSETYEANADFLKANALYLPYQEGIYLTIKDTINNVSTSTVNDKYAELEYENGNGRYILSCREPEEENNTEFLHI